MFDFFIIYVIIKQNSLFSDCVKTKNDEHSDGLLIDEGAVHDFR